MAEGKHSSQVDPEVIRNWTAAALLTRREGCLFIGIAQEDIEAYHRTIPNLDPTLSYLHSLDPSLDINLTRLYASTNTVPASRSQAMQAMISVLTIHCGAEFYGLRFYPADHVFAVFRVNPTSDLMLIVYLKCLQPFLAVQVDPSRGVYLSRKDITPALCLQGHDKSLMSQVCSFQGFFFLPLVHVPVQ
jgi:hypothetical protein